MSSLLFHTDELQAFIATDTLGVSENGNPFIFTTKAFVVPHLQMVMCGTGIGGLLGQWFVQVNDRMIVKDIDNLDHHTPAQLMDAWRRYKQQIAIPDSLSTTVYHFGFPRGSGLRTYAYRSKNNFRSESVPYGFGSKPPCELRETSDGELDIKRMMEEQRAAEALNPARERIWIGGEIIIHHLTRDGCLVYAADRFDDFDATENEIYKNFTLSL
jgi:hypothetical protein